MLIGILTKHPIHKIVIFLPKKSICHRLSSLFDMGMALGKNLTYQSLDFNSCEIVSGDKIMQELKELLKLIFFLKFPSKITCACQIIQKKHSIAQHSLDP